MRQKPAPRIIWAMYAIILVCLASFCNADAAIYKSNEVVCNDRQQAADNLFPQEPTEDRLCSESDRDNIGTKNPAEKNQQRVKSTANVNSQQNAQWLTHNSQPISTRKFLTEEEHIAAYRWSQQNQFQIYPPKLQNLIIASDEIDVTLVTQLSLDRLSVFEQLCQRWTGPISAAIYVPETSMNHFNKYIKESRIFSTRQNIGCQIVKAEGEFYPINYLRNVALQNSQTNYNFLNDVDFIPSGNLYENIRGKIATYLQQPAEGGTNKTCLVIPAFKLKKQSKENNSKFPGTKDELLAELNANRIAKILHIGHFPTKYDKWITATEPYFVKWAAIYEPYIVIDKNAPKYDSRYVGYGSDKVSHIMEVAASGYKFLVMHDSFIIHMPHSFSKNRIQAYQNRSVMGKIMTEFLINFLDKYGNTSSEMVEQILRNGRAKKFHLTL